MGKFRRPCAFALLTSQRERRRIKSRFGSSGSVLLGISTGKPAALISAPFFFSCRNRHRCLPSNPYPEEMCLGEGYQIRTKRTSRVVGCRAKNDLRRPRAGACTNKHKLNRVFCSCGIAATKLLNNGWPQGAVDCSQNSFDFRKRSFAHQNCGGNLGILGIWQARAVF